jgi:HEPN domain-containing protein
MVGRQAKVQVKGNIARMLARGRRANIANTPTTNSVQQPRHGHPEAMRCAVDRKKLQNLAKVRLKDAKALLGRKRWSGAYYLCGYVIECALKSCLLRHLGESASVFGEQGYLKKLVDCWTHDLVKLVNLAGLDSDFGAACGANASLNNYWLVTKDWKESSRYEEKSEADAKRLYEAVSHKADGVFRWIQSRW